MCRGISLAIGILGSFLALVSPIANAGFLYALNSLEGRANALYGFQVNESTGSLTTLSGFPVTLDGIGTNNTRSEELFYDSANARLFALNVGSSTVSVFSVNRTTGGLTALPYSPIVLPIGDWACLAVHPSGSPLVVGDKANPRVMSVAVTATTALVVNTATTTDGTNTALAASCVFSRDGNYFYTSGNSNNEYLAGFGVNAASGGIASLPGSPFFGGSYVLAALATDSQGRLFATGNGIPPELRVFTTSGGVPTRKGPFNSGLNFGIHGIVHPAGYYVVADRTGSQVGVYRIDGTAAAPILSAVAGSPFGSGGSFTAVLALNQAGNYLFAANGNSRNITSFQFDGGTGILTRIDVQSLNTLGASGRIVGLAYASSIAGPLAVDLNQHGLTGSWYEAATGGQGVEIEMFANPSSGSGSTFVSWFTYDTVAGGAERQRWYTAQGPVVTGQPYAALTIYRNTGGNFNAPPVTNAQVVGTATLSFDTCASGQLAYAFTDGTGHTGTIPLTRLTQNVTCSTTTSYPTNADFALSGNWFGGAATSGQGFTVEVNPISGALFAAWYTYLPNGTAAGVAGQRWYTAQATFTPGLRTMPVTIYETTGGVFDTPPPPGQKTVPVGTGTMAFQSCSAATFSYNFTGGSSSGLSGTINLNRVGPLPPGCTQ